jgi:hypothetical protein
MEGLDMNKGVSLQWWRTLHFVYFQYLNDTLFESKQAAIILAKAQLIPQDLINRAIMIGIYNKDFDFYVV